MVDLDLPRIKPRIQLKGEEREKFVEQVIKAYGHPASIRQICKETGRSYGAIYRVLVDNNVTLRPRGGKNNVRRKS